MVVLFFPVVLPSHENPRPRAPKRICILAHLLFLSRKVTYSSDSDVGFSKNPQAPKGKRETEDILIEWVKKRRLVRRKESARRASGN